MLFCHYFMRKCYFVTISWYFTKYIFIFTTGEHFNHTYLMMFDDFPVVSNYGKLRIIENSRKESVDYERENQNSIRQKSDDLLRTVSTSLRRAMELSQASSNC